MMLECKESKVDWRYYGDNEEIYDLVCNGNALRGGGYYVAAWRDSP